MNPTASKFGLAFIAKEGCPIHPDDLHWDAAYDMPDHLYIKQLQGYCDSLGLSPESFYCSRPHLLKYIVRHNP